MYKKDLAFNNQQWLICHKTKPNQTKYCAYGVQSSNGTCFPYFTNVLDSHFKGASRIVIISGLL